MKIKVDKSIGDRTDCYLIGRAIAELRCSLHAASHELSEGDRSWAKTYLYDAEAQCRVLGSLHPGTPVLLRTIIRGVSDVTKRVLTEKPSGLQKEVVKLREATLKLQESTKAYCGVTPFQEKRKTNRS